MSIHTEVRILKGEDGTPAFAVVPYGQWLEVLRRDEGLVPHEVVNLVFDHEWTPMRAWREYLGLTQEEVGRRAGISQAAYAQMEGVEKPRMATLKKIAVAMGLSVDQLHF